MSSPFSRQCHILNEHQKKVSKCWSSDVLLFWTVFRSELGENTTQNLTGLKVELDLWLKEERMFPSSIRGRESHSSLTQTQGISEKKKNHQIKLSYSGIKRDMRPQCKLKNSFLSVEESFTFFQTANIRKKSSLPNIGLMKNMASKFRQNWNCWGSSSV